MNQAQGGAKARRSKRLARDGVDEFLFVLGQPKFRGAVQMVVNPIAIR